MISMANGTTKYHLNCKCYLLTTPKFNLTIINQLQNHYRSKHLCNGANSVNCFDVSPEVVFKVSESACIAVNYLIVFGKTYRDHQLIVGFKQIQETVDMGRSKRVLGLKYKPKTQK